MRTLFICLTLLLSFPLLAAESHWYDQGERRSLHADPDQIAEVSFRESAAITRQASTAPTRTVSGIRLISSKEPSQANNQQGQTEVQGATVTQTTTLQVPVFRDQPRGAIRVAIGNVLLQLPQNWSDQQRASWLAEQKLTLVREIPDLNLLIIASEPGYPNIELANRLAALPEVISASPDWWQPVSLR